MKFENMTAAANRADIALDVFDAALEGMRDVIDAVKNRIDTVQTYYAKRTAVLNEVIADKPARPVIRQAAQNELDTLVNTKLQPTDEEKALFDERHTAAMDALEEMRVCEQAFIAAYSDTLYAMEARRKEITGRDLSLRARWISSTLTDFRKLSQ